MQKNPGKFRLIHIGKVFTILPETGWVLPDPARTSRERDMEIFQPATGLLPPAIVQQEYSSCRQRINIPGLSIHPRITGPGRLRQPAQKNTEYRKNAPPVFLQ